MGLNDFKSHLETYLTKNEIEELIKSLSYPQFHSLFLNNNVKLSDHFTNKYSLKKNKYVDNAYYSSSNELGKTILHDIGAYYMQEYSSTIAISNFKVSNDSLILDMCSAPGGKGIFASLINKDGVNILNDVSNSRCQTIINNVERLGLDNVVVTNNDFTNDKFVNSFLNHFDYIILDAPCSGSGMFRKNPNMIEEWSKNQVDKFSNIQRTLIINAYKMLKPGGKLMYSTCSLSKEEDEDVVNYLLKNSDATISKNNDLLPNKSHHLGLYNDIGEGLFVYYLEKPGELIKSSIKKNKFKKYETNMGLPSSRSNIEINGEVYSLNKEFDFKNLHVVRYGVKAFEKISNTYKPTHHNAKALNMYPKVNLNEDDLRKYIRGDLINVSNLKLDNGYVILNYNSINVGLGKYVSGVIKNLYPKGLRHN